MNEIYNHSYYYSPQGMYFLHLQAKRAHQRAIYKTPELAELRSRLSSQYPPVNIQVIPKMNLESMPPLLLDYIRQFDHDSIAYKVEWFYASVYLVSHNHRWFEWYRKESRKDNKVFSKVHDTMGFMEHNTALKMWLESIDRPESTIRFEGWAYHQKSHGLVMQTAFMMSILFDYEHAITLTVVKK